MKKRKKEKRKRDKERERRRDSKKELEGRHERERTETVQRRLSCEGTGNSGGRPPPHDRAPSATVNAARCVVGAAFVSHEGEGETR